MKKFKKIISLIILAMFFVNNENLVSAIDNSYKAKELTIARQELKSLKNWDKYISQIDNIVTKYKNNKKALKKLANRVSVAKSKLKNKNDLKSKKLMIIINYLKIKLITELLDKLEEKIEESEKITLSSNEQKKVQDKIVKLQLNLLEKWASNLQSIIYDFEKLSNYEEKGNLKMSLNIDQEQIGQLKTNLNLEDYIIKNSNFDSQITWKIDAIIDANLKWQEKLKLEINSLIDYINKDWNMYIMLEKLNIKDEKVSKKIKDFIELLRKIVAKNKYIKFEDKSSSKVISLLKNLNPKKIFNERKVILSKPMFRAYKKEWEKYLLVPTKHACDIMKNLSSSLESFNSKRCNDKQYKDLLETIAKWGWEFYIELWENTKLWYYLKGSEKIEKIEWYIIFSDTNIEKLLANIQPNKEMYPWEWLNLSYERNNYLNMLFYANSWETDIKLKSYLDKNNNFSFMDFSWKTENADAKLTIKNQKLTGNFEYKHKSYDWNSWKYVYLYKIEWKINGNTGTENKLKNISLKLKWTDAKTKKVYLTWIYKYHSGKFNTENFYSTEWNQISLIANWNWDSDKKIIDELNFNLSAKTRKDAYDYNTYKYPWNFEEIFYSNIKLKNKAIEWITKVYKDSEDIVKINHYGEFEKDYLKIENDFEINSKRLNILSSRSKARDSKRKSDIYEISYNINDYFYQNWKYPETIEELAEVFEKYTYYEDKNLPKDPLWPVTINNCNFGYKYKVGKDKDGNSLYKLSSCLENENSLNKEFELIYWNNRKYNHKAYKYDVVEFNWKEFYINSYKSWTKYSPENDKIEIIKWSYNVKFDTLNNKSNANIYLDLNMDNKKVIEFKIDNTWTIEYKDGIKIKAPKNYIDSEELREK